MSKGLQLAIGVLVAFAGIAWLVAAQGGSEGTFRYYTSVAEYRAGELAAGVGGGHARVHGFVQAGSIERNLHGGYVDFAIRDQAGALLPVRLDGIELPDLFKDDAEVVVEGRPEGDRFLAARVFAKCPSKYEAAREPEA
jgi:cytochrome c-type biogenesis protein CcmE